MRHRMLPVCHQASIEPAFHEVGSPGTVHACLRRLLDADVLLLPAHLAAPMAGGELEAFLAPPINP